MQSFNLVQCFRLDVSALVTIALNHMGCDACFFDFTSISPEICILVRLCESEIRNDINSCVEGNITLKIRNCVVAIIHILMKTRV